MRVGMLAGRPFVIDSATTGHQIMNFTAITKMLKTQPSTWQAAPEQAFTPAMLEAPIQQPRQIFALGMNYEDHAREINEPLPQVPSVFTKYASALTGPVSTVARVGEQMDWETELVAVIDTRGRDIAEAAAEDFLAGYLVGEDFSARDVQFANDPAQFSLSKSFANFAPIGPWLTTPDEIQDLGALTITTTVNGKEMQHSTLAQLHFTVPALIHYLSTIVELQPGDLIFTGTPAGTGTGRDPQVFLQSGDHVQATIAQLGDLQLTIE